MLTTSLSCDPRFLRGKLLVKEKRYEESISVFGNLLESMLKEKNDIMKNSDTISETETDPSLLLAIVYHEYGHALLLLSENSSDVFGSEIVAAKEEAIAAAKASLVQALTGGQPVEEEDEVATKEQDNVPKEQEEVPTTTSKVQEDEDEARPEPSSDLELAWEMLEMARIKYTFHMNKKEVNNDDTLLAKELAHVYLRLGDLSMESGHFLQSRRDYEASLKLTEGYSEGPPFCDNAIADLHCCMAMACVYQNANPEENSKQQKDDDDDDGSLLEMGRDHYIKAGKVMIAMIFKKAKEMHPEVNSMLTTYLPKTSNGKASKSSSSLSLNGNMEELQNDIIKLIPKPKCDSLLELLDIYVELKEKAEGITIEKDVVEKQPVTQIGFTNECSDSTSKAAPVNLLMPVRKKRKVETTEAKENEQDTTPVMA